MTTATNKIAHIYNPANMSPQELIDNFVVRQKEFRRLFAALKDAPMERPEQHYIVVGPRGSGKSTLLQRLYYEIQHDPDLNPRVVPILFPEEQYQIISLAGLWENVLEELDHEPGFAGVYDDFEAGLGGDNEEYAFEYLVRVLQSRGRKLILFLENIGDLLAKFTDRDHQRFRERLLTCAELRIVGGSAVVLEHTYNYSQPLFDFFQFEYLRELNRQEVNALLTSLARSHNEERVARILSEQPERVEILRRLTGGIPRTIVLLFEIFADEERGDSFKDLQQVLDRVTPLYKHRMDELTPGQQQIIANLAIHWEAMTIPEIADQLRIGSADTAQRKALDTNIEELVKNSLLQRVAEPAREPLYQIAERFFNIWYLMRYGRRNDRNRVRWFVRFLEAWCSPEDLEARARKHLSMLRKQNIDPLHAVNITQALANTCIGRELQDSLIRATRRLLLLKDASLLEALSPSDNELFAEAVEAYDKNRFRNALEIFNQIVNMNAHIDMRRAWCYVKVKDINEAERYYKRAVETDSCEAFILSDYANFLADQRQAYDAAEQYFKRALKAGQDAFIRCMYADFLQSRRQDYDRAEQYYTRAIEMDAFDAFILKTVCVIGPLNQRQTMAETSPYDALWGRPASFGDISVTPKSAKWRRMAQMPITHTVFSSYADFLEVQRKDYAAAERYYLRAIDQGDSWSIGQFVSMCLTHCRSRKTALKYSIILVETSQGPSEQFQHAAILVWNRRIDEAIALVQAALAANPELEPLDELRDCLLMLIAAEAYEEAWKLFNDPKLKLQDRYRPVYYALLYFDRENHPAAYERMGSEFRETVEELVARITEWRRTYFPEG